MKFFGKKSILKNAAGIGSLSLLSKFLGIGREFLLQHFLGTGVLSDAFFTAYKIPNSLRKIFAEGALSAATVPTLVNIMQKEGKETVNRVMAAAFLVFESALLLLCVFAIWRADLVISFAAPGFSPMQARLAIPYLQILMPFIFFLSTSALLAGALQSVKHFFVPAISPALLNVVFITSLIICITNAFPPEYLCVFILIGGFVQLLIHIITYLKLGFSFQWVDRNAWAHLGKIMVKFLPCLVSMSIMEVGLFVDTQFASFLPPGSISLVRYANRFMGIPLSVLATSLSTVLLPYFSHIIKHAPKRVGFYLLEAAKIIFWATIPMALIMGFFSEKIFTTIFTRFSGMQAIEASVILTAFLTGLFFFSLNKILLSIYYAKHNTWIPTIVSIFMVATNIALDYAFIEKFQAAGLALATSIAFALQVIALVWLLKQYFGIRLFLGSFLNFVYRYILQMFVILGSVYGLYRLFDYGISQLPGWISYFLLQQIGFWLWVGPLCGLAFLLLYLTRRWFKIKVYFLD